MPDPLDKSFVTLGVSGSIACHKAVDLASKLAQAGARVDVVMTRSAANFVTPLAFRSLTHRPVVSNLFDPQSELSMDHVAIAERAHVMVVAPATANIIARMAWGLAEDALTTTVLATRAPIIVCPAMDGHMYENAATQENIEKLRSRGITIAGPAEGYLASGSRGLGRMLETRQILGYVRLVLGRYGDLAGRKIVVTAGGTQEAIDPVRYISNRSSGKMGYAVAEAARDRGAAAVIVAAPSHIPPPVGVSVLPVVTALEMRDAVGSECRDADALIMAAAVADWRPGREAGQKLKKGASRRWNVELTRTPDILAEVQGEHLVKVGFAAETEDVESNARAKLKDKGLHLIAANDVTAEGSGFGTDTNKVFLLDREGGVEGLGLMSKYEVGHRVLDRVAGLLRQCCHDRCTDSPLG